MAQKTQNFGLHQWEPTDYFLREDFNQDLRAIDGALARLRHNGENTAYDLYRMLLREHYERRYTGYKKGLLFSLFTPADMPGARLSPQLILSNQRLTLYSQSQQDISLGFQGVGSYQAAHIPAVSPQYGALWTGTTCQVNNGNYQDDCTYEVTARFYCNDKLVFTVRVSTGPMGGNQNKAVELTLPRAVPVGPADACRVEVETSDEICTFVRPAGSTPHDTAGGTYHFTPVPAAAGTFALDYPNLPAAEGVRAWVRCVGGTVGLRLTDGAGKELPLTLEETRSELSQEGKPCTEFAFLLRSPLAAGRWTLELNAHRQEATMEVLDYGLVLL